MDRIPLILAITVAGIVVSFTLMYAFPPAAESDLQKQEENPDDGQLVADGRQKQEEIKKIEKDCSTSECLMALLRECQPSEVLVTFASNATQLMIIDGDGIYHGERVCLLSILQRENVAVAVTTATVKDNDTPVVSPFQSWSCKVSFNKLSGWATSAISINELTSNLISSGQCQLTAP